MATVQLSSSTAATIYDRANLIVQTKRYWSNNWQTINYLEPQSASLTIAPATPIASFIYRYGKIKREDSNSFDNTDPLNIANHYVRIVADNVTLFVGIFMDDSFDLMGALGGQPAGDQSLTAYGLEHLIDRVAVWGAQTANGWITHTPAFNRAEKFGGLARGNRSENQINGAYVFDNFDAQWSNLDIILYVLKYHSDMGFNISLSGQYSVLADLKGVYYFEGLTIRQILDKLIDRRRGLGWHLWSDGFSVNIYVFTVFENDIGFGGAVIPGNANQQDISMEGYDVETARISLSQAPLYDEIVIQGSRARSCFTVSLVDGNLTQGWKTEDETNYKAALGADNPAKDKERKTDKYAHVYQRYLLPENFNGMAGNGVGGEQSAVMPDFDDTATAISGSSSIIRLDRPLLRKLPITDTANDYLAPMVFGAKIDPDNGNNALYFQIDKSDDSHSKAVSSVRMLDELPGFQLNATIPHALALNDFNEANDQSDIAPEITWQALLATVAIETDTRPTVRITMGNETDAKRTLLLAVPDVEFWYLCPGTVTEVNDGRLIYNSGGIIRDDTEKLRTIAAMAMGWYGRYRGAIELKVKDTVSWPAIGSLILSASSSWHREAVGTVVSSIVYDFVDGTTEIKTGHAELDIATVLDIPGMSDFRSVGRAFNRQQSEINALTDRVGLLPVRSPAFESAANNDADAVQAVDFIVDNFDRADSIDLGSYWTGSTGQAMIYQGDLVTLLNKISVTKIRSHAESTNGTSSESVQDIATADIEKTVNNVMYVLPLAKSVTHTLQFKIRMPLVLSDITYTGVVGVFNGKYATNNGVSVLHSEGAACICNSVRDVSLVAESSTMHSPGLEWWVDFHYPFSFDNGVISNRVGGIYPAPVTASVPQINYSYPGGIYCFSSFYDIADQYFVGSSLDDQLPAISNYDTSTKSVGPVDEINQNSGHFDTGGVQSVDGVRGILPFSQYMLINGEKYLYNTTDTGFVGGTVSGYSTVQAANNIVQDHSRLNGAVFVSNISNNAVIKIIINGTTADVIVNSERVNIYNLVSPEPDGFVGFSSIINEIIAGGGITQFKAWVGDVEPPDSETGHGKFIEATQDVGGHFQFTDKYHSTDENGNVIYNPDA